MNKDTQTQREAEGLDLQGRITLRPKEAAAALGICERKLRDLMRDGGLPFCRVDRGILIPVSGLRDWIMERVTQQATADQIVEEILDDL